MKILKNSNNQVYVSDGKVLQVNGGGEFEPKLVETNLANDYVNEFVSAAEIAYPNETSRILTIVDSYEETNADILNNIRKEIPEIEVVELPNGVLKLRDNLEDRTYRKDIDNSSVNICNVSPKCGDFIVEDDNIKDCGVVKTEGQVRFIYTPNLHNVRDCGGWDCDDGTVKYGLLFRGADLNDTSEHHYGYAQEEDIKILTEQIGIKSELDFSENTGSSSLGNKVEYKSCFYQSATGYLKMVDLSDQQAITSSIKPAIETVFANIKANKPTYFHCQLGADRTGTLAFILGAMLGMSEVDLDIEYELTSFSSILSSHRKRNRADYKEMIDYFKTCSTSTNIRDCVVAWAVLTGINIDDINEFRHNTIDGNPSDLVALIDYSCKGLSLGSYSGNLGVGETKTLVPIIEPLWWDAEKSHQSVTAISSDTSKVTTTVEGNNVKIVGVSSGDVQITISCGEHSVVYNATVEALPYTNLVSTSIDTDGSIFNNTGYMNNVRLSSTGNIEQNYNGICVTGLIPFVVGDVLRFKGCNWNLEDLVNPSSNLLYIRTYDENKEIIVSNGQGLLSTNAILEKDSNGVYTYTSGTRVPREGKSTWIKMDSSDIEYIRITSQCDGANLIVTRNEEIV